MGSPDGGLLPVYDYLFLWVTAQGQYKGRRSNVPSVRVAAWVRPAVWYLTLCTYSATGRCHSSTRCSRRALQQPLVEHRFSQGGPLPCSRACCVALGWPGMVVHLFF